MLTIFPTAVMNGSDRIRHDTFCDSFFYATGMPCCKWMRDINKWEEAILTRRKMHEL